MKLGIYSSIANPPRGDDIDRCIDEVIAEAQLAEQAGFDACFFGEHHQDKDGFLPSPLIMATAVACHTQTLRVGTSVILLPLHHPVKVAEDVVTLDLVSKGRVILGVGLGYQAADFRAFNVPIKERVSRLEESVEIIRLCWAGEPFSFHGKHFDLEDVQVRPRPYQQPAPPLLIGASNPPGARRAGKMADGFVSTPSTGLEATVELIDTYREAASETGRDSQVVLMRDAWRLKSERGRKGLRSRGNDRLPLLLASRLAGVQGYRIGGATYAGPYCCRPAHSGRPGRVCQRVSPLGRGYGRRALLTAIAPCPLGRSDSQGHHEYDKPLR